MNILVSACLLGMYCRYDGQEKINEDVVKLMEHHTLIPICPEQAGGMMTPRLPSERRGNRVVSRDNEDVTAYYEKGAYQALKLAKLYHCKYAVLKERSPSCGVHQVYDGTFSGKTVTGQGVAARLLQENEIQIMSEDDFHEGRFF